MFLLLHNSMEKFELSCYMVVHLHNSLTHFGFPDGSVVKNLPANAGDAGSIPGLGKSPGEGIDNPLQYPCLGNPMDYSPPDKNIGEGCHFLLQGIFLTQGSN